MMDWTDRHCRYFHRLLSPHALLYTEMVTTGALLHGNVSRHLAFHSDEHPVALQLGGSEPEAMARCAELAERWGYDEVNINVGCPSDRVQSGAFGACLMAEPDTVASCVAAMKSAVSIPVTVKTRIGIDDMDDYQNLFDFTAKVIAANCDNLTVHARKAWLKGLSPKENRDIPPLMYDKVYQLKRDYPELEVCINGGITDSASVSEHLRHTDGVMIGRAAYQNPWWLVELEQNLFDELHRPTQHEVVEGMLEYIEAELLAGGQLKHITRHMLGLFQAVPGAKQWRRHLSENAHLPGAGPELLRAAAAKVSPEPVSW
ncbi:tRNA-dihydrouridine synthase A [gamma proteobacterium HTCC5015]|nr:tRNA-dihydrouridine synthase A [gamma proteobacterium HTCC5015]